MRRRLAVGVTLVLAGCSSTPERAPVDVGELGPPPAYAELAERYNAGIAHLDRLWARTTVVVRSTDEDGERHEDQGEGYLQVVRPDRLALSVGKIGETLFYLGSNETEYWWFDLTGDEQVELFGRHDKATSQKSADFGVPVHPLDLIEVLGVIPLPETGEVGWAETGQLDVRAPGRFGERVLTLDPETLRPSRVRLLDSDGETAVDARLERYQQVEIVGAPSIGKLVATRLHIDLPAIDAQVMLSLYEPTNKAIKDVAFDRERLTRMMRIDTSYDLDDPDTWGEPDSWDN